MPGMKAYIGGTGSAHDRGRPAAERLDERGRSPSAAPSVSASGFSWPTASTRARPRRSTQRGRRPPRGTAGQRRSRSSRAWCDGWRPHVGARSAPGGSRPAATASRAARGRCCGRSATRRVVRVALVGSRGPASAATRRADRAGLGARPRARRAAGGRACPRSAESSWRTCSSGIRLIRSRVPAGGGRTASPARAPGRPLRVRRARR